MGKAKASRVGGKRVSGPRRSGKPQTKEVSSPVVDLDAALTSASHLAETGALDDALRLAQAAAAAHPREPRALELVGSLHLDMGDILKARRCFEQCWELDTTRAVVALYLAQLSAARDAVAWYERAIALLQADSSADRDKLAEALCGLAEIYLTDLCFESEAPEVCKRVLAQARSVAPTNPDLYATMASVQISLAQPVMARETLLAGLALWLTPLMAYLAAVSDPTTPRDAAPTPPPRLPDFDARLTAARLCIELGLYAKALDVLAVCVRECDDAVDVWYLFGWAYYLIGSAMASAAAAGTAPTVEVAGVNLEAEFPEDGSGAGGFDGARTTRDAWWGDAIDCLQRARALYLRDDHDDAPLLQHVDELLAEMAAQGIAGNGDNAAEDEDDEDHVDGEWEDMDE